MKAPKSISKEKLVEMETILPEISEKITGVPHILILGALIEEGEAGWTHLNIDASSSDLIMMLSETLKKDPRLIEIFREAIKVSGMEDSGRTVSLGDSDPANSQFIDALREEIKQSCKSGSITDVDDLLNGIIRNDEGGDQQE